MTLSLAIRLITESFNRLEREILFRRLEKVNKLSQGIRVLCIECNNKNARIECIECKDHFCIECFAKLHTTPILKGHTRKEISTREVKERELQLPGGEGSQEEEEENADSKWKKFEYFNFPTHKESLQYERLRLHYLYLRQQYLDQNFIKQDVKSLQTQIDFNSLFLHSHSEEVKQQLQKTLQINVNLQTNVQQDKFKQTTFNDEELLFANRIVFYLIKQRGQNLCFKEFFQTVSIFQVYIKLRFVCLFLY